jgi:hypothetical protein
MISSEELVLIDLDPILALDPTIRDAIPSRVEAECVMQGWTPVSLTDQQSVFVATQVTRSLVTRLLLKFSQEVKKTAGGAASVEFQDAIKYLQELKADLDQRRAEQAYVANPSSIVTTDKWPGVGFVSF